jgi:hypothetical protein
LDGDGGPQGVGGAGERGDDGIPLALLHRPNPAGGGNGDVKDLVVPGDRVRHRGAVGLPAQRRSFDVGEQERHRPGRQGSGHQGSSVDGI